MMIGEEKNDAERKKHWDEVLKLDHNICPWELDAYFNLLLDFASNSKVKLLEVGSGHGRVLKALARSDSTQCQMTGLDKYITPETDGLYEAVQGDALCMPFEDNEFDLVFSLGVVEHFPETIQALKEHIRVLRKGGSILVTVPHLSFVTPFRWINYVRKYRHRGSFEQTLGRNMTVRWLATALSTNGVHVTSAEAKGFYFPGLSMKLKIKLEKLLPRALFGSYVVVIGIKK